MAESVTLASIADELYGLVPAEFTPARNARALEGKDSPDAELAQRVRALRAHWAASARRRSGAHSRVEADRLRGRPGG